MALWGVCANRASSARHRKRHHKNDSMLATGEYEPALVCQRTINSRNFGKRAAPHNLVYAPPEERARPAARSVSAPYRMPHSPQAACVRAASRGE